MNKQETVKVEFSNYRPVANKNLVRQPADGMIWVNTARCSSGKLYPYRILVAIDALMGEWLREHYAPMGGVGIVEVPLIELVMLFEKLAQATGVWYSIQGTVPHMGYDEPYYGSAGSYYATCLTDEQRKTVARELAEKGVPKR